MKKLFVRIISLVTAVVLIAVLCSCGKKKQDDKIHISVMIGIDPAEGTLMKQWKDAFEVKHPEICVDIRNLPDSNYLQAMSTNVQSPDQMPDIMWTTGEQHAPWSEEGIFVDLSERIKKDDSVDLGDFYEEVINITHKNSKDQGIYFMPRDYNKCVIFINKYMFRAAGFSEKEILSDYGGNNARGGDVCHRIPVRGAGGQAVADLLSAALCDSSGDHLPRYAAQR